MIQSCSNIIEFSFIFQWQPYKNKRVHISSFFCNTYQLHLCLFQKIFLPEQISTGISSNTEFRKNHDLGSLLFHFMYHANDLCCIKFTVCYANIRCSGSSLDKTILHSFFLLFALSENFF